MLPDPDYAMSHSPLTDYDISKSHNLITFRSAAAPASGWEGFANGGKDNGVRWSRGLFLALSRGPLDRLCHRSGAA
ncbi:MHC class II antigen B [Anopheles sinensis]|uniref:MHC class II antigen B n=1 Tax=Anopheles sinensis TaxID=74873 RepID=A0A084W5T9_ANOSI|nr:MHC class II antigen B [Anopheles sinensis]